MNAFARSRLLLLLAALALPPSLFSSALDWLPPGLPEANGEGDTLCPGDYLSEEQGAALLEAAALAFDTRERWEDYAALARRKIQQGVGMGPLPPRTPLRARFGEPRSFDGYTVENVLFESIPGYFVGGNLYRPSAGDGPFPAVLSLHGHTSAIKGPEDWARHGRFTAQAQTRAAELARRGAVVLSIDAFGYGDSVAALGPEAHRAPLAMTLQVWNGMRALDLIEALLGVDATRLAATGESGGGTQTFLLAALDGRVAVSAPVVMVSSHFFGGCPCESGLPIHRSEEHFVSNAMIAALFAPKPQLLVSVGGDWSKNTPRVEYPFLRRVYGLYGKRGEAENAHFESEGHDYGPSKRGAVYDFLSRRIGIAEASDDGESGVTVEPPEAMRTLKDDASLPSRALRSVAEVEARLEGLRSPQARRIHLIGDSTLAPKSANKRPEMGWGEALGRFFNEGIEVVNHAVNGRSSKSFRDEGRWDRVLEQLQPGDWVAIQFGHNDQKDQDASRYAAPWGDYADNLKRYAEEARQKGAEAILLTSICRRKFDTTGRLLDTHGEYPEVVRAVAAEIGAPLVDMEALSRSMLSNLGDEPSKRLFLHLAPGEHANYPGGVSDDTHLVEAGAAAHAELFARSVKAQAPLLSRQLAD